jgi:hypothetical protein
MTDRQTAEQRQAEGIATILRERNAYRDALEALVEEYDAVVRSRPSLGGILNTGKARALLGVKP